MKLADFVAKIDPWIIDDQPVLLQGEHRLNADSFGVFPQHQYVINITSKRKKVYMHFEINAAEGVQILGFMLRDVLYQMLDEYADYDLIIFAEMIGAGEGEGYIDLMADLLWADVKLEGDNVFVTDGSKNHSEGGLLGALANWNRAYIEHLYTRF